MPRPTFSVVTYAINYNLHRTSDVASDFISGYDIRKIPVIIHTSVLLCEQ